MRLLFLTLISLTSWGQISSSRGGFLRKPEFQTYGNIALFVDTTGDNTNDCLSATTPCATLTGALTKLPQSTTPNMTNVFNNVTITVAAGTYTESPSVTGFWQGNLTITGPSLANITPATGTATGTITTSGHSTTIPSIFTDSGQSWTTNNLRGRFFCITSGAVSGQCRAIVSNTATTITVCAPFTADPGLATYALQSPAAIFTSSTANPGATFSMGMPTFVSGRTHAFTNVDFVNTGTGSACQWSFPGSILQLTNVRCVNSGASGRGLRLMAGHVQSGQANSTTLFQGSSVGLDIGAPQGSAQAASTNLPPQGNASAILNRTMLWGNGASASALSVSASNSAVGLSASSVWTALSTGTTASIPAVYINAPVYVGQSSTALQVIRCDSTSVTGLTLASNQTYGSGSAHHSSYNVGNLYIDGCGIGVLADQSPVIANITQSLTCTNGVNTCVQVSQGAQIQLPSTLVSDAGTTDVKIDSNLNYSFGTYTNVGTKNISSSFGSRVFDATATSGPVFLGSDLDRLGSLDAGSVYLNGKLTFSSTTPTISSGFGTTPSITGGSAIAFRVNVGTGGVASTGVIALPTAPNGWNCSVADVTTPDTNSTVQTASTATTASFKNYARTTGLAAGWTGSDILAISCIAF